MSLIWGGGKLAVAYYDVETTEIYLMIDTVEQDDFQLLRKGKTCFLFPNRT